MGSEVRIALTDCELVFRGNPAEDFPVILLTPEQKVFGPGLAEEDHAWNTAIDTFVTLTLQVWKNGVDVGSNLWRKIFHAQFQQIIEIYGVAEESSDEDEEVSSDEDGSGDDGHMDIIVDLADLASSEGLEFLTLVARLPDDINVNQIKEQTLVKLVEFLIEEEGMEPDRLIQIIMG